MKVFVISTFVSLLAFFQPLVIAQAQIGTTKQDQIKKSQDELGIIGPIRIQIIPETGALVITGENEEDVKKVQALVKKLIESAQRGRPESRVFKLKNAHAQYVASWAQHVYDLNFAARQGAVTITAHSQSEVFIVGPPAAIDEAKKIVTLFDR